jgi:uncharacterized protein YcnI
LLRPLVRSGVVAALLAVLLALGAGVASAHVTVSSPDASAGGFGKVTFRVPTESDTASTVKVRIQLPTDKPFASVSVQPVAGWTVTTTKAPLNPPVTDDDGNKVTEAVSVVEFDAPAGGGIAPGQFQEFSLSVGPFPKSGQLVFNVVQDYSDGTEVAWIDPQVAGQPEPEHPAPVLKLAGSSGSATDPSPAAASTQHGGSSSAAGVWALVVAIVALVVALVAAGLAWAGRRRTVSS